MQPVILTGLVLYATDDLAVVRVGQGLLLLSDTGGQYAEGDLLELTMVAGTTYAASYDPRIGPAHRWVLLCGPYGTSAITVPRGTQIASSVDISVREVPLEVSEGFDLDPDTSDDSVPAAGPDPDSMYPDPLSSLFQPAASFPIPQ